MCVRDVRGGVAEEEHARGELGLAREGLRMDVGSGLGGGEGLDGVVVW
jgi:hypothetical protein